MSKVGRFVSCPNHLVRSCTFAHTVARLFTRPEFKVERTSYPVITPSAARGLLEAVLWKPAIAWHIRRIKVLRKIAFTSFRRNEVNSRAVSPGLSVIQSGGQLDHFFAEDERAQRNTVALRDVHMWWRRTFL